jgi:hypothetical protein
MIELKDNLFLIFTVWTYFNNFVDIKEFKYFFLPCGYTNEGLLDLASGLYFLYLPFIWLDFSVHLWGLALNNGFGHFDQSQDKIAAFLVRKFTKWSTKLFIEFRYLFGYFVFFTRFVNMVFEHLKKQLNFERKGYFFL